MISSDDPRTVQELQGFVENLNQEATTLACEGIRLESTIKSMEESISNIPPSVINLLGEISKLPFLTKNMRFDIECAKINLKYLLPEKPDYRLF